ncbi:TonB-dependent receptor [Bryobacter aggregatus]|uniref:TonB-dependent receptor n=1 Tax=Bryobacter aggregatus TaxID=360054 RepID=UPI0004E0E5C0|nr:carboxypeptidase regulatory-like domain-containing protein [Bryobacter aggregatus]
MLRQFLCCILCAVPGFAQAGRSELFGAIQDPAGLPIAKALVEVEDQATATRSSTRTDERGEYHLLGLAAGQYLLKVEQPGFRRYRQTGIRLRLADRTLLNVTLEVGQPSQSIEITAAAPLLQTASGELSFHMDEGKILTLPLDGRNFIPLVTLAPGVALPNGQFLPRINGSRPRTNEYIYDGISVLQPEPGQVVYYPIIDGMAEFKLNINAYSPEYGRSNGGTVMVIGKSGSNQFHGSAFEFFRNEALNARNLFAQSGPKPQFRRNQYGVTLGGPIEKNKTFFFADWQGTRLRTGITRFSVVPTLTQRQGVFTQAIFDPLSSPRVQFPNNTIPASRIDPIAAQLLQHYPLPNVTGANNFVRTATEPDNQDQADFRIDRYFGEKHRVFARYTFFRDDDNPVTPLPDGSGTLSSGVIGHAVTRGDALVGDYNWVLSPNILNQFRFGYSRRALDQTSLQNGGVTIPGLPANSFSSVLPIFSVAGFQQLGPTTAANSKFSTSVTEFLDTVSVVRGRHTIKFGADIRREALSVLNPPNPTGSFGFSTTGTNSSAVTGSGNALASLLLGQVNAFSIDIQKNVIEPRAHIAEFFIGDDWKVSPRLTLNIGTRYTLNFPSTERNNQGAVFNLNTQLLEFPHTARNLEYCNFGPRVGLAYRMGNHWTVRSGYGMVFSEQSGITTPFTIPQFPFVQTLGQQSPDNLNAAFALSSGPTVQVTAPNPNSGLGQGVFGVDRTNGSGYSQQWNFTVQRTIGKNWNVEAAYLGSKNTRLGIPDANINQLPSQYLSMGTALLTRVTNPYFGQIPASSSLGAATLAQQQLLRPYPRFTNVALFRDNVGNSSYHAASIKLEKRLSRGLTLNAVYTYSKLIDDASSVFSQTIFTGPVLGNTGAADAYNRHLEKDLSSGDIPRVFAMGWVYEIPKVWKISGWQIAGLLRIQSGDTVAVTQATNNNSSLGFAVQRPNRTRNPNELDGRSVARYFDTSAFVSVPQFVIGNSSRNPVRGPGLQNADLMLGKTFRFREQLQLELRAEAFNVSNTPPLNDPNGSFGSAAFGSITSAGNPRVFEFVAKIRF